MAQDAFEKVLDGFDTAMLVTRRPDGSLHGRPMAVARSDERTGDLWFATSEHSGKVTEIEHDSHAVATFQGTGRYLGVTGRIEVVRDARRVRELWRDSWKPWFPKGPADPEITLLRLNGTEAEYWDQRGLSGVRYAFEAAKAAARGERVQDRTDAGHGRVDLDPQRR